MSRQEIENVVGLARSPAVKRTPRGCTPAPAGDGGLSGATTARMSTVGSVRSIGSSVSASSEARCRHVLQPLAANSMCDNSLHSSGGAAHTPCAASPLDMISLTISSKKKAVAARRPHLPVSRTLKLSPAADTTRQHPQESVVGEARTAAEGGSSMPYPAAADHTQCSITQSALLSTLDRLPSTPYGDASSSYQGMSSSPRSGSLNKNYQDQPATPPVALGETDFLGSGDISNIDEDRSDSSFTNAVFSPEPATLRVAYGVSNGIVSSDRGASARREHAPATRVSPIVQEEGHTPPAAEIAMRAASSVNTVNAHPSSTTTSFACTPGAVSALLRMGGHSVGRAPTPDSVAAGTRRYRGYVARTPLATSGAPAEECGEEGERVDMPNTPTAVAALTAMMMGTNSSVRESETGTASAREEEGEVRSYAEEDAMEDDDEKSAPPVGVQPHQLRQPTPETPSRRDSTSARRLMITPRTRKAASQLEDLSNATPKGLIKGILNGPPVNAAEKQRQQHTRFVPQVPKLVEDAEEETPRTRLKRVCAQETSLHFAAARTRCNSTSVAEAAAAAAAAAAATAAASTAAAVAESAKTVDDRAAGGGAEDASVALPHSTAQPPHVASSPATTAVVVHSGLSAKGVGKGFLKILLGLILLMLLAGGALIMAEGVAVVVCLAFAGPPLAQPIY